MKNLSFTKVLVALSLTLCLIVSSCIKESVENNETIVESKSEIDWLEKTSKVKFFRQKIEVSDLSGKNKITLLIASTSMSELDKYISQYLISLLIFDSKESYLALQNFSANSSKESINKVQTLSDNTSGVHVEILKKELASSNVFYVFDYKSKIVQNKNAKVAYNHVANYYSNDGADTGFMTFSRPPLGTGGNINQFVEYSFARRNGWFQDYGTVYSETVESPYDASHPYSYRGHLRVNYDNLNDFRTVY